ncbi:hypothetical protein AB0H83_14785 [Dactylosporangium sp. NPDC050688]|uniref:tRNA ligase subunit PheS family protein n=1 Tax=Dactylosporangium sp. NPDC050688 TaxID=3157217 RepID=UPI0033DAEDD4
MSDVAAGGGFDLTCPPPAPPPGGPHPLTTLTEQLVGHLARHGFAWHDSSQLEDLRHSFDLLGVPDDAPLRTPRHTFFIGDGRLLRSHTTASALRRLREHHEPARFVVTGACYRNTVPSVRQLTQFHSVEAVATGPQVRLSDLKGLIESLAEEVLDWAGPPRLRYHRAVPYVVPGLAVELDCRLCRGDGCDFCFGTARVEIGSGGLLTREVLRSVGVDDRFHGVALSISLERVLALRHRIGDVRWFLRNDLRVLDQLS